MHLAIDRGKCNMIRTVFAVAVIALSVSAASIVLELPMWSASALAMGGGGGGGGGAAAVNPYKYYPVCPLGRAGDSCQCRVAGNENANILCRAGEHCDTRSGTCVGARSQWR
jgi:hypothetical protein